MMMPQTAAPSTSLLLYLHADQEDMSSPYQMVCGQKAEEDLGR